MQQSSVMVKPVEEPANTKAVARRKGWDTVVAGRSGGLGGFLVLGGVLLTTAFTARAAFKRRQQPGKEPKMDMAGEGGSKDIAAAAAACCDGSSNGHCKEARYREDLLLDPSNSMEKPTPVAASVSPSIPPQHPASTNHQLTAASTHMDSAHRGVCRFDDVMKAWASVSIDPRSPATEGVEQPEQEPMLQDSRDSRLLVQMEPCNSNCSTAKVGIDVVLSEPIDAEVDGTKILHSDNGTLQSHASAKGDENAKVVECGQEEAAGAEVDRDEILLLPKENLPKDTPAQAYDEDDEAKVEGYDEEESGVISPALQGLQMPMVLTSIQDEKKTDTTIVDDESQISEFLDEDNPTQAYDEDDEAKLKGQNEEESGETIPSLQGSEMSTLLTSIKDPKNTETTIVDDESHISEFLDEALQDNKQQQATTYEDGDYIVLSNVEDKNLNETELPLEDSEKPQTFNSIGHQNITSEDVHGNTDSLSRTFGIDVRGIEVLHCKDKVLHEEKPLVEPGAADEADKLQVDHEEEGVEEKEPLPRDLQDSDPFSSAKHANSSSCIARKSVSCDPDRQDMDKHGPLLIQSRLLQEEGSPEELTAGPVIHEVGEPAEVVIGETGLLSQHSKCPRQLTLLEANGTLTCIDENEFGNLSQQASRGADELGVSLLQNELQQDSVVEEAEHKMCKADDNGSIKEQFKVEHISDGSLDDSTGSGTEASWPMDETNSYSSLDEYGMKPHSDIATNGTEAHKDVPNEQNMVFHDDQQEMCKIASLTKTTGKLGLSMKRDRVSFLQLAYPLVALILVLLIVYPYNRVFDPYRLLYKLFYPSSPSS